MEVKLFTAAGCTYCTHAKTLLERANLTWTEVRIGSDISMEEFRTAFPDINQTPYTLIDDTAYATIADVAKFLLDKGLVTVPE
tara:strand:- start:1558 stop:1806 length:249 start_codon:yes stop_codon:yes gene_type:complete